MAEGGATAAAAAPIHHEQWGSRAEFILSIVGYSVGLGNLWRFPYLCYSYGGGSFLIPYFTCLLLLGIPLYVLELTMGQMSQSGITCAVTYRLKNPRLYGLALASTFMSLIVSVYYNVLMAWAFVYLIDSFQGELPWEDDAQGHFYQTVLEVSSGIGSMNKIVWPILGSLVVAWVLAWLALSKGILSSGKVVYVTATLPYMLLIILFFRGITLPGAREGIEFYLKPDTSYLFKPQTWLVAGGQIFFSLGTGWGSLIAYASHNKLQDNIIRDATFVPIINCATSFFAGFAVFSMIGHFARNEGKPVDEVIEKGTGLAFVVYPAGLAELDKGASNFFSVLFFIMVFLLGIDSLLGLIEGVMIFAREHGVRLPSWKLSGAICLVCFLLGIPLATDAGIYWLDLLDSFVGKFGLYTIVLLECLAVTWIYQGFRVPSVAKNIETGDDRAISIELTSARTGLKHDDETRLISNSGSSEKETLSTSRHSEANSMALERSDTVDTHASAVTLGVPLRVAVYKWVEQGFNTAGLDYQRLIERLNGRRLPNIFIRMWKFVCPFLLIVILFASLETEIFAPDEDLEGKSIPNWADGIGWIFSLISIILIIIPFFFPYSPPWCSQDSAPPAAPSNFDNKSDDHGDTGATRPIPTKNVT